MFFFLLPAKVPTGQNPTGNHSLRAAVATVTEIPAKIFTVPQFLDVLWWQEERAAFNLLLVLFLMNRIVLLCKDITHWLSEASLCPHYLV